MSLRLFMDVHVRRSITEAIRVREVDVLTAQEDGSRRLADPELMDRATLLARVLFSQDKDMLREACSRQRKRQTFSGLIFARQNRVSVAQCISDLELMAKVLDPHNMTNRVEFLPLR